MKRIILLALSFCALFAISSCDSGVEEPVVPNNLEDPRMLVTSEGQFGYGTSSLTLLKFSGEVFQDLFRAANARTMGDVAQSITKIGDNFYVPINASRKVEVFNAETFESVETIPIEDNVIPIHLVDLGGGLAALKCSQGEIYILDIDHSNPSRTKVLRVVDSSASGWQHMIVVGDKLFVGGTKVVVFDIDNINTGAERVIMQGTNAVSANGIKLVQDKDGMIWVKSVGSVNCIDPNSETVIKSVSTQGVDVTSSSRLPQGFGISAQGDKLYYNVKRTVYEVEVDNPTTPTAPVIDPVIEESSDRYGNTVYYMGVSKQNTVMLIEVRYGSLDRSRVFEYNLQGEEILEFTAGIFSSDIYYY